MKNYQKLEKHDMIKDAYVRKENPLDWHCRHQRPLRKRRPRHQALTRSPIRPRQTRCRNPPDTRQRTRPSLPPRVHFKIIVFDLKTAYVGSANLTGAGLGMKGENTRNFEAGVLSSNHDFVKNAAEQFDSVWMGDRKSVV